MGIFRKPKVTKHKVEVRWEGKTGKVFINGEKHGYVSFSKGNPLDWLAAKPLKASNPVEVDMFRPLVGEKDEPLKRQGIATEVHRQLEDKVREMHPDTDALVALVHQEDLRIDSYEAAKAAIKFYERMGYRLHQKVAVKDGLGDNPAFRGEFRYPISYVYVMEKKLK